MDVLITGGTGNLARHCLAELCEHGHRVTLFDRYRPEEAARPWTVDVPVVVGDLTNRDDCWRAVEIARAEAIVQLGAIAYPSESEGTRRSRVRPSILLAGAGGRRQHSLIPPAQRAQRWRRAGARVDE